MNRLKGISFNVNAVPKSVTIIPTISLKLSDSSNKKIPQLIAKIGTNKVTFDTIKALESFMILK